MFAACAYGFNLGVMGSLNDIRSKIQRARAAMLSDFQREALKAGADAAALVENRIVTKGETAEGQKLSPYSTKPVPAFFYFNRSRNNAGEQAVRKRAKAKQGVSYKEFRQLNGLNTTNKNLEFTGEMWQAFGVKQATILRPGVAEVVIGGKNSRSESLLGYHSDRENTDITKPSQQEVQAVQRAIAARLTKLIENA